MIKTILKGLIRALVKPAFSPLVSIKWRRRWLNFASASMSRAPKGICSEWFELGSVPTFVAYPEGKSASTPSAEHILYVHGGGYVSGGVATHGAFIKHIAAATQATVWMPDYRLAPEHPYPAALEDVLSAYEGLLAVITASKPTNSPMSLSIIGDSAGGGLALACAQVLRDTMVVEPQPQALILFSPWVDLTCSSETYTSMAAADPMLNPNGLRACAEHYCGALPLKHTGCSPLFGDLGQLPPLLIQVGSEEVLLQDALTLAEKAKAAGTTTTLHVYEGMWHVFQLHVPQLQVSRDALAQTAAFYTKLTKASCFKAISQQ